MRKRSEKNAKPPSATIKHQLRLRGRPCSFLLLVRDVIFEEHPDCVLQQGLFENTLSFLEGLGSRNVTQSVATPQYNARCKLFRGGRIFSLFWIQQNSSFELHFNQGFITQTQSRATKAASLCTITGRVIPKTSNTVFATWH